MTDAPNPTFVTLSDIIETADARYENLRRARIEDESQELSGCNSLDLCNGASIALGLTAFCDLVQRLPRQCHDGTIDAIITVASSLVRAGTDKVLL